MQGEVLVRECGVMLTFGCRGWQDFFHQSAEVIIMIRRQPAALIGAHISIAGGTPLAFGRGVEAGCAAMQIFTKNATRWEAAPLAPGEAARFRAEQARTGIAPVVAHGSYLINLASPGPGAPGALAPGLPRRASPGRGAGPALRHHPPRGAHGRRGRGRAGAGRRVPRLARGAGGEGAPLVCLENTAGPGTVLAGDFAHLGAIFARVRNPGRPRRLPRHVPRARRRVRFHRRRPRTTPLWRRSRRRSDPAGSWRSTSTTPRASGGAGSTVTSISGGDASAWSASGSS